MSVIVTIKFSVSAHTVEKVVNDHADTMAAVSEDGRRHGALHHQFTEDTDGNALVIDEWPDAESFHQFFAGQQDIPKIMAEAGVTEQPVVTTYRVLDTPDRF